MTLSPSAPVESLRLHVVPVSGKTTWLFVELRLADGDRGWGEVTDFANETAVAAEIALIEAALIDQKVVDLASALQMLAGRQVSQARRVVRSGIEQAWLDLQARAAGVTLARQLGGCYRQAVPVYANINRGIPAARSPQAFASQARLAVADGYRAIKIAPFDSVHWQSDAAAHRPSLRDIGIERVLAVRDAIGSDVRLLIDCHGRFDAVGASVVIDALAAAQPFWLEDILDPVFRGDDGRSIRQQAHRHGIRVAGGEELAELGDFLALLETASTDVVLPDLRLTGIRAGMIICEVAAARGQQVSLHNPVGPVLDAVSRHVAAALPNFLILERPVRESPIWEALGVSNAGLIDGDATLEAEAGLGVDLGSDYLRSAGEAGFLPGRVSYRGLPGAGPDA